MADIHVPNAQPTAAPPNDPIDPFIGAEPELPIPEGEEPEPAPEPEAEPPADDDAGEAPEAPPATDAKPGDAPPPVVHKKPSWSDLKQARKELEAANARAAELERERETLRQERERDRAERIAEQARLREIEQLVRPKVPEQPWTPGANRRPTAAELKQLEEDDPFMHSKVVAQIASEDAFQAQQQTQVLQHQMVIRSQIDDFQRRQPDYIDAVKYLEEREVARARAGGIPEQFIPQYIQDRAGLLIQAALQQGKSVPELAYAVAQADGWKPEQAAPAAPAQTGADRVRESKRRSEIERGAVANAPGGSTRRAIRNKDDVLAMSDAEMEHLDRTDPGWADRLAD